MGLSQLHQLRGRVGRGRERAYAYFLYPPEKPLTETAHDRLATIAAHSDLGAGMCVAMKDLEIRGAGNLLGGEQSGHIAAVGFDLYVRLVGEAVAEFKGEGVAGAGATSRSSCRSTRTCRTTTSPGERLRLEAYRKLAAVGSGGGRSRRCGPSSSTATASLPTPVENLLGVARFRTLRPPGRARRRSRWPATASGSRRSSCRRAQQLRLQRLYPGSLVKPAVRTILVPKPMTARVGGQPLRDVALLDWCREVVEAVLPPATAAPAASAAAEGP